MLNYPKWTDPTLKARAKYAASGSKPRFIFFRRDDDWSMDSPRPMQYATALACFRRLDKLCGFGEKFTLRSPRDVLPTWGAQLGWRKEDRTALGRRAPISEMPNRFDRAVCNTELRLRNEIIQRENEGWKPSASFDLPKKKPAQASEDDLSSVDSASAVNSSDEEVNIADLDDTNSVMSGYAPSV